MKKKVLALVGPTAVGKTEYALELAKRLSGEIISADSVQIYEGMIIGSARPSQEELAAVAHYMIGNVSPFTDFTVANYRDLAQKAIEEVIANGNLPIVSGGTGLYLNSLIYEMDFNQAPVNPKRRQELTEIYQDAGQEALHAKLMELDSEAGEKIHPNNVKRVIRAIEILEATGKPMAYFENIRKKNEKYDFVLLALNRDRQELYNRIDQRVDIMMDKGLLDEVKALKDRGLSRDNTSMLAIGYKEIMAYFQGKMTLDEAVDKIKQNSRNYAKRQITWFKRYDDLHWFDLKEDKLEEKVVDAIVDLVRG